jgi:hypothetical protein
MNPSSVNCSPTKRKQKKRKLSLARAAKPPLIQIMQISNVAGTAGCKLNIGYVSLLANLYLLQSTQYIVLILLMYKRIPEAGPLPIFFVNIILNI